MTLPDERYRAVKSARDFLRDLLDPKKTPRVPREVRRRAASVLKHYPWDVHMEDVAKVCPRVFEIESKYK